MMTRKRRFFFVSSNFFFNYSFSLILCINFFFQAHRHGVHRTTQCFGAKHSRSVISIVSAQRYRLLSNDRYKLMRSRSLKRTTFVKIRLWCVNRRSLKSTSVIKAAAVLLGLSLPLMWPLTGQ